MELPTHTTMMLERGAISYVSTCSPVEMDTVPLKAKILHSMALVDRLQSQHLESDFRNHRLGHLKYAVLRHRARHSSQFTLKTLNRQ